MNSLNPIYFEDFPELSFVFDGVAVEAVSDHSKLSNRDLPNQHPMSAITGLEDALNAKAEAEDVERIEEVIPSQATALNPLTTQEFVNSSVENVAAYFITKDARGNPFSTKAELSATSIFYSGGTVRVPTRNDYTVVLNDESNGTEVEGYTEFTTTSDYIGYYVIYNNVATRVTNANKDSIGIISGTTKAYLELPTTRYIYDNGWNFQYIVNNSGLTFAQYEALVSGITSILVNSYNQHLANNSIHMSSAEKQAIAEIVSYITDTILIKEPVWDSKYTKPSSGIPNTDLAESVQISLGKADSALQSHQDISGKADLVDGVVPSSQLPSYVDDVLEYANFTSFPTTGESGKIYLDKATNKAYRWGGSSYVAISSSVELGETSSTAYRGDKGKIAYDHSQNSTVHVTSSDKANWDAKADREDIPTKTSELENDSGFLDESEIFAATYGTTTFGAIVQALTDGKKVQVKREANGNTYIYDLTYASATVMRFGQLSNAYLYTCSVSSENAWSRADTAMSDIARMSDLDDYAKTADIPTKVSELTNDSGFIDDEDAQEYDEIDTVNVETISIDSAVTDGSNNLITSGAVYSYIASLNGNEVSY